MNISTTERIVGSFSNKELKTLVMAVRMYNMTTKRTNDALLSKLVDSFLLSNELEAEVIDRVVRKDPYSKDVPKEYWGTATGKAYLAELEEASTKAYSY